MGISIPVRERNRMGASMKNHEINIRDPFVLVECDTYYMYGTRAKDFGRFVGGVDVYISKDLENWSEPFECFNAVHQIFVLYREAVLKHTPFPNLCHRILMQFFQHNVLQLSNAFPKVPDLIQDHLLIFYCFFSRR